MAASTQLTGYLAPDGFTDDLIEELGGDVAGVHGRLVLMPGPPRPAAWAANVWLNPVEIPIRSISDAAKKLRAIQRDWALYAFQLHRRAQLIASQLPQRDFQPIVFQSAVPRSGMAAAIPLRRPSIEDESSASERTKPFRSSERVKSASLGSWTLLDENLILASPQCSSPFPNGEITFQENRDEPPSRAYLKLWELFTRLQIHPQPGEHCVDLGASPGGWTWVLQQLGANVIAVDKAPLAPRVASFPGVTTRRESAFGVQPKDFERVDWLFSDVACYPERLLKLVERWLAARFEGNMVCTLKFQGKTDHATARAFAAITGSNLVHLHHNGHELTWYRLHRERR